MVEKLILPFSLLADVEGEVIRRYGVWHEEEEIAQPAVFVIDEGGVIRYAYVGRSFADRPSDETVWQAIQEASETPS
jgi:peroxiredoxin